MIERDKAIEMVVNELDSANRIFPMFNSPHEGYAVIKEELDELWDEIKKGKYPQMSMAQKKEATQVAAMALKFLMSCCVEHL